MLFDKTHFYKKVGKNLTWINSFFFHVLLIIIFVSCSQEIFVNAILIPSHQGVDEDFWFTLIFSFSPIKKTTIFH